MAKKEQGNETVSRTIEDKTIGRRDLVRGFGAMAAAGMAFLSFPGISEGRTAAGFDPAMIARRMLSRVPPQNPAYPDCGEEAPGYKYSSGQDCPTYACSSEVGDKFWCEGGILDDFECTGSFVCEEGRNQFVCEYSFDDEDCEGSFTCIPFQFVCTGQDYN